MNSNYTKNNILSKHNKELDSKELEYNENYIIKELKRIIKFYKKRCDILILVIVITILLNNSFKIIKKSTKKTYVLKGGGSDLSRYLLNTSILENLKEQFPLDKKINYIMVGFGYFMLAFVIRPIKAFFMFILIIFAISGSFLFPFLLFGIMLYYVMKKIITKKKPLLEIS